MLPFILLIIAAMSSACLSLFIGGSNDARASVPRAAAANTRTTNNLQRTTLQEKTAITRTKLKTANAQSGGAARDGGIISNGVSRGRRRLESIVRQPMRFPLRIDRCRSTGGWLNSKKWEGGSGNSSSNRHRARKTPLSTMRCSASMHSSIPQREKVDEGEKQLHAASEEPALEMTHGSRLESSSTSTEERKEGQEEQVEEEWLLQLPKTPLESLSELLECLLPFGALQDPDMDDSLLFSQDFSEILEHATATTADPAMSPPLSGFSPFSSFPRTFSAWRGMDTERKDVDLRRETRENEESDDLYIPYSQLEFSHYPPGLEQTSADYSAVATATAEGGSREDLETATSNSVVANASSCDSDVEAAGEGQGARLLQQNALGSVKNSVGGQQPQQSGFVEGYYKPSVAMHYACPPTSIDMLRRLFGTRRSVLGDWTNAETRQFYRAQLPRALQIEGALGLTLAERAKLASEARHALRIYARERCCLHGRVLARLYDGVRHLFAFGSWNHDGMSWADVQAKYAAQGRRELGADASPQEIEIFVYRKVVDRASSSNEMFDRIASAKAEKTTATAAAATSGRVSFSNPSSLGFNNPFKRNVALDPSPVRVPSGQLNQQLKRQQQQLQKQEQQQPQSAGVDDRVSPLNASLKKMGSTPVVGGGRDSTGSADVRTTLASVEESSDGILRRSVDADRVYSRSQHSSMKQEQQFNEYEYDARESMLRLNERDQQKLLEEVRAALLVVDSLEAESALFERQAVTGVATAPPTTTTTSSSPSSIPSRSVSPRSISHSESRVDQKEVKGEREGRKGAVGSAEGKGNMNRTSKSGASAKSSSGKATRENKPLSSLQRGANLRLRMIRRNFSLSRSRSLSTLSSLSTLPTHPAIVAAVMSPISGLSKIKDVFFDGCLGGKVVRTPRRLRPRGVSEGECGRGVGGERGSDSLGERGGAADQLQKLAAGILQILF